MHTILMVEDNASNSDVITRRLERRGYVVALAVNGATALVMANDLRPDVVLMDMSLPVMDGLEATRALKGDAALAHIPVIMLTAHAFDEDQRRAFEAGADGFVTKPIDFPRLLATIRACLGAPDDA